MNRWQSALVGATLIIGVARPSLGGDFRKPYLEATQPGTWSRYSLTAKDGPVGTYTYRRNPDQDGRIVLELGMKTSAGGGSESAYTYIMPRGFDLARDGLSYGKLTESMSMNYGGTVVAVDEATLEVIRETEKDYRGAVTFEATETIDGHACDRYAYALKGSGSPAIKETGRVWLAASVPFGVVRQVGQVMNADGSVASTFEMKLQEAGQARLAEAPPAPPQDREQAVPSVVVSLSEGYRAGHVSIEVEAVAGSAGRELRLTLRNETDGEITVEVPAGNTDLEADSPIDLLRITARRAASVVLPAQTAGVPLVVGQRGTLGTVKGKYTLQFYEGAPAFHGSVTLDELPK